jgi:hypothetical protein
MSMHKFKVHRAGVLSVASVSSLGSTYLFAPVLKDRELYRTPVVNLGDDIIDLQSEVAVPYSPTATSWAISGSDSQYFKLVGGGLYFIGGSGRSAIPRGTTLTLTVTAQNAISGTASCTLTVKVPLDTDCRFVSWQSGNDGSDGLTPSTPWKTVPGTGLSTSQAFPTALTLTSKVMFFRGERHRTSAFYTSSGSSASLPHSGTPSAPMVYAFSGWGGRAVFAGDDALIGSWQSVTQAEVYGNPNWANIKKISVDTGGGAFALDFFRHLFCGDTICYPAQYPKPTLLNKFEGAYIAANANDQSEGMKQIYFTTLSGDTTVPRVYRPTGGANITIVDPALNALFNNQSFATAPGMWVCIYAPGNNTNFLPVLTFDATTNTLVAASITGSSNGINVIGGNTSYGLILSPASISVAGQYALSQDGKTIYCIPPNNDQPSVSVRNHAFLFGVASNVVFEGGQMERYAGCSSGDSLRARGGGVGGGHAFVCTSSTAFGSGNVVRDFLIRHNRSEDDDGAGVHVGGSGQTGGLDNANLERFRFRENPRSSGFRFGTRFEGRQTGSLPGTGSASGIQTTQGPTAAEIRAWSTGKIRWNYVETEGIGRTFILLTKSVGAHVYENVVQNCSSVHGNGVSLYNDSIGTYTYYNLVELNLFDNMERPYTTSITNALIGIARYNTLTRNVFLGRGGNASLNMTNGEPNGTLTKNIFMRSVSDAIPAAHIYRGYNLTVTNNVVAGFSSQTTVDSIGGYGSWNIDNNYLTYGSVPANGVGGAQFESSGNQGPPGTPTQIWDKTTIPSTWQTTLGAGQIGPFWTI